VTERPERRQADRECARGAAACDVMCRPGPVELAAVRARGVPKADVSRREAASSPGRDGNARPNGREIDSKSGTMHD